MPSPGRRQWLLLQVTGRREGVAKGVAAARRSGVVGDGPGAEGQEELAGWFCGHRVGGCRQVLLVLWCALLVDGNYRQRTKAHVLVLRLTDDLPYYAMLSFLGGTTSGSSACDTVCMLGH